MLRKFFFPFFNYYGVEFWQKNWTIKSATILGFIEQIFSHIKGSVLLTIVWWTVCNAWLDFRRMVISAIFVTFWRMACFLDDETALPLLIVTDPKMGRFTADESHLKVSFYNIAKNSNIWKITTVKKKLYCILVLDFF